MATLRCPKCNHALVIERGQTQASTHVTCASCQTTFKLRSDNSVKAEPVQPVSDDVLADDVVAAEFAHDPFADLSSQPENDPFYDPLADPANDPLALPSGFDGTDGFNWALPQPTMNAQAPNAKASASNTAEKKRAESHSKATKSILIFMLAGGALAGVGLLALVGVAAYKFFGSASTTNGGVAQLNDTGGAATEFNVPNAAVSSFGVTGMASRPVVFDKPVQGVQGTPPPANFIIVDRKLFSVNPASLKPQPEVTDVKALPEELPQEHLRPRWDVAPDPEPPGRNYSISPSLNIKLNSVGHAPSLGDYKKVTEKPMEFFSSTGSFTQYDRHRPILASNNGPFVLLKPQVDKSPYGWKLYPKAGAWSRYEPLSKPTEPLQVVDLRSGQPVGAFDPRVPFWLLPILSPDGKTLVGPASELPVLEEILKILARAPDQKVIDERQRSLYVWKRDSKDAPLKLSVGGNVRSMAFANDRALVVVKDGEPRILEVWDTISGKQARSIPLTSKLNYTTYRYGPIEGDPINLINNPPRHSFTLAVSAGGKYAAVLGETCIEFLSLHDGKPIGQFPLVAKGSTKVIPDSGAATANSLHLYGDSCFALQFSPDGQTLTFIYAAAEGRAVKLQFNVATGEQLDEDVLKLPGGPVLSRNAETVFLNDLTNNQLGVFDFKSRKKWEIRSFPEILRVPDTGPVLAHQTHEKGASPVPVASLRLRAVARELVFESEESLGAEYGFGKRLPTRQADRSAIRHSQLLPLSGATPLPKFDMPQRFTTNRFRIFPSAWSKDRALVLNPAGSMMGSMFERVGASAYLADLRSDANKVSQPISIYPNSNDMSSGVGPYALDIRTSVAISEDGKMIANNDRRHPGIVEVWSAETGRLLHCMETGQDPGGIVAWVEFDAKGNLLMLEDGVLSSWDLSGSRAKGRFAVHGNYVAPKRLGVAYLRGPMLIAPGRQIVFISREQTLDAIETESGKCVGRYTLSPSHYVTGLRLSPDGIQLAVHYAYEPIKGAANEATSDEVKNLVGHQVAIWNLADGTVRTLSVDNRVTGCAWAGPKHLALLGSEPSIYDIGLEMITMVYGIEPSSPCARDLRGTDDGTIWAARKVNNFDWGRLALFTEPTTEEIALLSDNPTLVNFRSTPVQLVLDLCDARASEKHSQTLRASMQQAGWIIGRSKYYLHVTGKAEDSSEKLKSEDGKTPIIPVMSYRWQLLDSAGTVFAEAGTSARFKIESSKYYNATLLKSNKYPLYFGSKSPVRAIIEELVENGVGLQVCPIRASTFLIVDGKPILMPIRIKPVLQD